MKKRTDPFLNVLIYYSFWLGWGRQAGPSPLLGRRQLNTDQQQVGRAENPLLNKGAISL